MDIFQGGWHRLRFSQKDSLLKKVFRQNSHTKFRENCLSDISH